VTPTEVPSEKTTVLVVDDDPLCVAVVTAKLESTFHVVSTTEPKRAVDVAREEMASIVLCDISMPGLSGDEVAYALTQDTWTRDIPVVYLTGLLDPGDTTVLDGTFGGHMGVSKGASTEELLKVIRRALRRA
jgi:putative two-component system response regulator